MINTRNILSKYPIKTKTFGNSMYPLLHDSDVVYIKKIKFDNIRINDITCVKKHGRVFTHRVIYRRNKYLITRGDNNIISDGKIYDKNLVGKVYKVKRSGQELNPEDIYLLQSTFYFEEIVKIKNALEKANIDFVFLKGLPLHLYYEGTHPRRFYADCDVLMSKDDFPRTKRILKSKGYLEWDTSLWKKDSKTVMEQAEISFMKMVNQFSVVFDIHFDAIHLIDQVGKMNALYDNHLIDKATKDFIKHKHTISVHGERFNILLPENLLVFLLFHLFRHNYKGAYRFEFIKQVLLNNSIDFAKTSKKIKEYKLENFIYPAIILLQRTYRLSFPNEFIHDITPKRKYLMYIKTNILKGDIFDEDIRINSGANKFKHTFFLSPNSYLKRSLIFLNKQVLYSIYLVLSRRFSIVLKSLR